MRLALYRHLQTLSPRYYARTRFGDIMSRLNTDIGEIQRVAAEVALAWVGNVLFSRGLGRHARVSGPAAVSAGHRPFAGQPLGAGALPAPARGARGDPARAQRRHRELSDRDAARGQAGRHLERAGARGRPLPGQEQPLHRRVDGDAVDDLPVGRATRGGAVGLVRPGVLLRRPAGHRRHVDAGDAGRLPGVSASAVRTDPGADGSVRQPGDGTRVAGPGARDSRRGAGGGRPRAAGLDRRRTG